MKLDFQLMCQQHMHEVHAIDEANNQFEAWGQKKYDRMKLEKKTWAEVVLNPHGKVVGHYVYKLAEKKIFLYKMEVSPEPGYENVPKSILDILLRKLIPNKREQIEIILPDRSEYLNMHIFYKKLGFKAEIVSNFFGFDENGDKNDGYKFVYERGQN